MIVYFCRNRHVSFSCLPLTQGRTYGRLLANPPMGDTNQWVWASTYALIGREGRVGNGPAHYYLHPATRAWLRQLDTPTSVKPNEHMSEPVSRRSFKSRRAFLYVQLYIKVIKINIRGGASCVF